MPRILPHSPALARGTGFFLLLLASSIAYVDASPQDADGYRSQQRRLVRVVAEDFLATAHLTEIRHMSPAVADAIGRVPRHHYVNRSDRDRAYANRPLAIGHGQTISQPFIVALMTELAALDGGARVLEVGTGSGYQAAVLAEIAAAVYSIEIIPALGERAHRRLTAQGYDNIELRVGDGNDGWPAAAPFDAILVTAGGAVPPALLEQLAPDGRLVIPVGDITTGQVLTVITRRAADDFERREVLPVRFVPLVDPTP